jgi:hypothetical protein
MKWRNEIMKMAKKEIASKNHGVSEMKINNMAI